MNKVEASAAEKASEEMYREHILDHYKNPRNKQKIGKKMDSFSHTCKQSNPLCGDQIELFVQIEQDKIKEVSFAGEGCAISQASASLLTEFVKGKTIKEISSLSEKEVFSLLGINLNPLRQKCALLSLKTLQMAVSEAGEK